MSASTPQTGLKTFLALILILSKDIISLSSSRSISLYRILNELLPTLAFREYRDSISSNSLVSSDFGENRFLILMLIDKLVRDNRILNKISEKEVVE
jgi:hypothetical protein